MSDPSGAEIIRLDSRRPGLAVPDADATAEDDRQATSRSTTGRQAGQHDGARARDRPVVEPPTISGQMGEELEAAVRSILAFLRRRMTGEYEVDAYGFDRELTEQVVMPLARPLYQQWWRVRAAGLRHVPNEGGGLLVANHAGTLPFDAVMTKLAVYDEHPKRRHVRELAADLALRTPVVGPLARKTGNTLAHSEDAINLLQSGELVGVWPEGFKGIGKHYRDRYKLQRFGRGGFVEVAIRAGVPIIPVATVGSEEIFPIVANVKPLARLLGVPYFPITWQFPLLGPLGLVPLPSKWVIEFGEPIPTESYGPDAADDPMLVFEITDRVRDTIQQMIYRNLMGRRSIFF
ncbi:lysophospholipid acyltransferase family protein [Euzebya tangerina]|uniref:lysophospholipid acyltransferase family protein n=1 Tax=Euzebya tangerina TaxID=591198 RepID=UPI000E30EC33|nr:lysophospholipid acyltransferase family protein [Euzebya tangerina]